jgi:hypothetical protein
MQELSSINVSDEPNGQNAPKKEQNAPPQKKQNATKKEQLHGCATTPDR